MMSVTNALSFLLLFILVLPIPSPAKAHYNLQGSTGINAEEEEEATEDIQRSHFPDGFLFGVSTSSYQIEGAILEDGKSFSDWDAFVHNKGIYNGDTGDIADDHYHRYLGDIEIIHSLGVDAYRFSISWPRILPSGKFGGVNDAGIKFYNAIIDNLILKGIKPFVTIHHGDLPLELQERYGGWLSPLIQDDFVHFAETCFENFGDRVKYWITINEPNLVSKMAFEKGMYPPCRCSPPFGNCSAGNSDTEPLVAMHNMLLSHAKASKLYRDQFQTKQGGVIGIIGNVYMYEPLTDSELDREAASLALAFNVAWTFDPVVYGDYPKEIGRYHGKESPRFTTEERRIMRDSIDFIGINHYGAFYAKACNHSSECACYGPLCILAVDSSTRGLVSITAERDGVLIGDPTGFPVCYVVPRGMGELVEYIKNRYNNKPIVVTENGYSPPLQEHQIDDLQHDDCKRVQYHKAYLASLAAAMRNGADVRGYFIWTLMDDFEWTTGYDVKFGLYSVNRKTLERTPRASAKWFKDFLRSRNSVQVIKRPSEAIPLGNKYRSMPNVKSENGEI